MKNQHNSEYPLFGIRILDLSSNIAGPYCSKMFADGGAQVLKVESPEGDPLRSWSASGADLPPENKAFFQFLNSSKESLVLDFANQRDISRLQQLTAHADLLIEDFEPGTIEDLGLDKMRQNNPALCVLSISSWGRGGPYDKRIDNEFTLQSWVGSVNYRGIPGEMPHGAGGKLGDFMSGASAAALGFSAILAARQSGRGSHVDFSKYEAMTTSFMTFHHILETFDPSSTHAGTRSIEIPSIERAADGWVGFCTITAQQFQDFCTLIEDPEMAEDERLLKFDGRMQHREEVWERISKYVSKRKVDEIVESASLLRIPVAPIGNGRSILEVDQFVERESFMENPGGFQQPRTPYRLEKVDIRLPQKAPELGQHGEWVEEELKKDTGSPPENLDFADSPPLPLAGLRVCDISAFWAGPLAANFLGTMGAEVIKVESHKKPDGMRFSSGLTKEALWEWSPVFHGANAGKKEITLDITNPKGMDLLKKIIAKSDFLIENFSPRVMENFGLTWEQVQKINSKTIMVRMPAFGLTGPWRDRTGFAMTIEQASGLAFLTGPKEGRPLVARGVCDPLGAMTAIFAALSAFRHRQKTGEGQLVEVPLVESGLNAAAEQVIEWSAYGNLLERQGNRSPHAAPQGVYPALGDDEWVVISIESDAQWLALLGLLGKNENTPISDRTSNPDEMDAEISAWTRDRTKEDLADILGEAGIPSSPVISGRDSINNPQLQARGFHQWMEHSVAGRVPYNSFPARFDGRYHSLKAPAPTLGQHSDEVLTELLGLSEEEVRELHEEGITGRELQMG